MEAADGLYLPVGSLEEAVRRAGLIAVVVPTGESQQEWFASETARANEMRVELQHPKLGTVTMPGVPVKLRATPGSVSSLPISTKLDAIATKSSPSVLRQSTIPHSGSGLPSRACGSPFPVSRYDCWR